MTIHLVGETIDKRRAHAQSQAGELMPIVRGVYVDANDNVDATILAHAVRIARYLYPAAFLSSASSVYLGPSPDGRLFLSGRRNQRVRLRGLEIVQNEAPENPSTATAIVGDDLGELRVEISSPRQRFLEAFRLRSEHASALTEPMRALIAARLLEELGSPRAAADAAWALARENGWYREGEAAERYLLAPPNARRTIPNRATLEFVVAWHGKTLGRLTHDGFEWRWKSARQSGPSLVRETTPGKLPAFIESLLPEGWLAQILHDRDERDALRHGKRYMSNIIVVRDPAEIGALPPDVLQAELSNYTDAGRFTGRYAGPGRGDIETTFEQNLARIFARAETPRLSGVQIKAPMCLTDEGLLAPATDLPFTHILKPAGTAGFETLPTVEWLCLELGRAAGFDVPTAALVEMPDGMAPALVVERFDIRRGPDDNRMLAMEDFCSVLDLPASAKYDGTIERMARAMRPLSTYPAADLKTLYCRAMFAWLIADGDMHLKNLALLKTAKPGNTRFTSVRFAPLYDAVTTRVFPGLGGDRMALKLNGKDDRLTAKDFSALARVIDLPAAQALAATAELCSNLIMALPALTLPIFANASVLASATAAKVNQIVQERASTLMSEWDCPPCQ